MPPVRWDTVQVDGKPIARGKTDNRAGIVLLRHPDSGYCGPDLTLEAYRACVFAQSDWLAGWIGELHFVSVVLGNCRIERGHEVTA